MSQVALSGNASGTGTFTIASPNSNTNRTLDLPDASGTLNTSGAVNVVPAGSAAAPAITTSGDTNTGIFFPAADTIAFAEGGVEAMRIDSAGNVGIGTSSPDARLRVAGAVDSLQARFSNVAGRGLAVSTFQSAGTSDNGVIYNAGVFADAQHVWQCGGTERARIASGGNLLVGTTTDNGRITVYRPSTTAGDGIVTCYSDFGSTNNIRVVLRVDGGIANYQANDTNLSDGRIKKNIELAGSYIEKICAIPVKLFNYKDENNGEQRTLGVIAQDVESAAPELIDPSGFGNTPEDGIPLKAIYQTDLQYALMKCIQEQQAIITALTARVDAQGAEIAALKGTQP
jgi:hypothetical protein